MGEGEFSGVVGNESSFGNSVVGIGEWSVLFSGVGVRHSLFFAYCRVTRLQKSSTSCVRRVG